MRVIIPSPLHAYTARRAEVEAEGRTVGEILSALDARYPGIRFRIVDEQERLRPHILVFVSGNLAPDLSHPLRGGDEVQIVASLSGG